jgi:MFS transporter, DHA3 family, macrolide efflux protein
MKIITSMNEHWKKQATLFLASQNISLFGSMLVQYAIVWHITMTTQSGIMMTISIICGFVPTFFLSPFAGVWADRYNRKMLIIISDLVIAFSTLLLAIIFIMGYKEIWVLLMVSSIRAAGAGIQTPAVGAFLPSIVPADKLMRVNGINSSVQSVVTIASPMLSGAILSFATIESIFFIDVVTAAIAILILSLFLQVPVHKKATEKIQVSYFTDLREGLLYIKNHSFVRTIFIFCAFFYVFVSPLAFLTPLQVTRSFGNDVWRLTAIEVAFSLGMMMGGILIASWGGFKNKYQTMVFSTFIMAIGTIALGLVPVFWIYLAIMGAVGLVMPMFSTPFTVLLQHKVEPDMLGRVFGVLGMISSSLMPLAMLVFGPVADIIRIEWLLIGTGILMVFQTVVMFGNKVLTDAGKPMVQVV